LTGRGYGQLDLGRRSWIAVQSVGAVCRSNHPARAWANTGAVGPILIAQNVAYEMEIAAYSRTLFQSDRRTGDRFAAFVRDPAGEHGGLTKRQRL
jgi:hypothetical protein